MTNQIQDAFGKIKASEELKYSIIQFLRAERKKRSSRQARHMWRKFLYRGHKQQ